VSIALEEGREGESLRRKLVGCWKALKEELVLVVIAVVHPCVYWRSTTSSSLWKSFIPVFPPLFPFVSRYVFAVELPVEMIFFGYYKNKLVLYMSVTSGY
jgi:hypothetical protein